MASTSTVVTVRIADLGSVQNLVVAAAAIIEGVGAEWIRRCPLTHQPVATADIVALLAALEGLEAEK